MLIIMVQLAVQQYRFNLHHFQAPFGISSPLQSPHHEFNQLKELKEAEKEEIDCSR